MRSMRSGLAVVSLALAAAAPAVDPAIPAWAFIPLPRVASSPPDRMTLRSLPGTTPTFTDVAIDDLGHAVDWFPGSHAPLPAVVAGRGGGTMACGYCHLPGDDGRAENASLAGLPADYIRAQVAAFAAGTRTAAVPDYLPSQLMHQIAQAVAPADFASAAD